MEVRGKITAGGDVAGRGDATGKDLVLVKGAARPERRDLVPVSYALAPVSRALVSFAGEHFNEAVVALGRAGFRVRVADTRAAARREILSLLDIPGTVGIGGTSTVRSLEIFDELRARRFGLLDPSVVRGREAALDMRRRQAHADYYLGSIDAVTLRGEVLVRDGVGNRIAGMCFGPRRTVLVAGINKVVANLDAAFARLEALWAVRRLSVMRSEGRPGRSASASRLREDAGRAGTLILHHPPLFSDLTLVLLREEIGL